MRNNTVDKSSNHAADGTASSSAPSSFREIRGQGEAIHSLTHALRSGRVPSAYLFLGPRHVGKRTTAFVLARALNCGEMEDDGCGRCPSCRKISQDTHPDVEWVHPEGQFIRIDQIREIVNRLGLIPMLARKRVIVFSQAERMNPQAANALLKTLEEPPENTLIVLCAESVASLPETIVSRCVPVRFQPLAGEDLRALLSMESGLEEESLAFLVRFAQGRLRPELLKKAEHWLQLRKRMVELLEGAKRPNFARLSEEIARWGGSEDWRFVLEWLESWFRDVALLGAGAAWPYLMNHDWMEKLQACASREPPGWAERCYERVLATREGILMNANKTLALEALWLGFRT